MGTRQQGPKSLLIIATAAEGASIGTIPGQDGATAIKTFLTLTSGLSTYGSALYKLNPFATANEFDEIHESFSGIILANRSVAGTKVPVCLSGQTIAKYTTSAPVQMGHQLEVAAGGTVSPANAGTDRLAGLAMHDAAAAEEVWVVTSGLWFGQVDAGALPARNVDCTSDASGRVVLAVATNVANCIAMSGTTLTILARPMRLFNVVRPVIIA